MEIEKDKKDQDYEEYMEYLNSLGEHPSEMMEGLIKHFKNLEKSQTEPIDLSLEEPLKDEL